MCDQYVYTPTTLILLGGRDLKKKRNNILSYILQHNCWWSFCDDLSSLFLATTLHLTASHRRKSYCKSFCFIVSYKMFYESNLFFSLANRAAVISQKILACFDKNCLLCKLCRTKCSCLRDCASEQRYKQDLQYGMGRKLPGKLLGFLSYFGKVMNAVGKSKNQGISSKYQSLNAAKKDISDFK